MCAFKRFFSGFSYVENKNFGIKFLDDLIGKIHPGMCILFEENEDNNFHQFFLKGIGTQGILNHENVTIITKEMQNISLPTKYTEDYEQKMGSEMKIAWRYNKSRTFCEEKNFNFTEVFETEELIMDLNQDEVIEKKIKNIQMKQENSKIIIMSFASPMWRYCERMDKKIIENTLLELKRIARSRNLIIFMSIPVFFYDFDFRLYFDIVFKNISSDLYDGILEICKFRKPGEISHKIKSQKYGYFINKNGINVENINLPPE